MIILVIYSLILGSMVGSFLTAWIWRQRHGRSMLDKHSVCPSCGHQLGPLDLLPILSWLIQKGRCRYCGQPISPYYLAIEVSTAALFILTALWFSSHLVSPALLLTVWPLAGLLFMWSMVAVLVALCFYDLRWGELPDIWTLGGSALAAAITVIAVVFKLPILWHEMSAYDWPAANFYDLANVGLSGAAAAAFFALIAWGSEKVLHKPGMGWGDVKLALLMGLFLGFPAIVVAIYLAFISGAVLSLILLAGKRKSWGQSLPFGPFLIAGTIAAIWITPVIVGWYTQFLP